MILHGDDVKGTDAVFAGLGSALIDLDGKGEKENERRFLREALHVDTLPFSQVPISAGTEGDPANMSRIQGDVWDFQ